MRVSTISGNEGLDDPFPTVGYFTKEMFQTIGLLVEVNLKSLNSTHSTASIVGEIRVRMAATRRDKVY